MAHEHISGLPLAFDRAAGKPEQQSVVFYGHRSFIQAAELNEVQTISRGRHDRLGRLVAKDGDRVEHADAFVDQAANTVNLTDGQIYVAGDVFPVTATTLSDVPMQGRVEIGIKLKRSYLTHEDDETLLGLVPGSLAEGEPGAAREVITIAWALQADEQQGEFFSVYTMQDGTLLDQRGPSLLEPAMQALAEYDRAHGHYVVSGCRVTALGASADGQVFSIEQGEANISGFKRVRHASLRVTQPEDWDEVAVPGETHIYTSGTTFTFDVAQAPIGVINSILLTKEKTATITRGATAHGQDSLPDSSIVSIIEVKQSATTYVATTDFKRTGNNIDWEPAGAEPAAGSSYTVKYRYRDSVIATEQTHKSITVSGGAAGGEIIVAYTSKMPRIDRIGLNQDGSPVYVTGVSAVKNPMAPIVPTNVLPLATVHNNWTGTPAIENDAVYSVPYSEQWRFFNRIIDQDRLIQLERLKSSIDSREPVAKKGMFVDPFLDDTYRDAGITQSGAVGLGMLQLAITPTVNYFNLAEPVTLDYTEEVLATQDLITGCVKINPYANFTLMPGELTLSPSADFWTEQRTEWSSPETININMGVTFTGPLQTTVVANNLIGKRTEQADFLRKIPVDFTIDGFGPGEILTSLTFDGVNVKPVGTIVANSDGQITGTFTIPANIPAGTKSVNASGAGGSKATAMFTGQGTISIDVMRRVTTVRNWTQGFETNTWGQQGSDSVDPQSQIFAVNEMRQILGVDFHLCHIGNRQKRLLVEQVTTDNGYPTTDVQAQTVVKMTGALTGWKAARYALPVTTSSDRKHAFVIKTDDNEHSVSIAKLGGFDQAKQRFVAAHPYVVGPRGSSVNAETWTMHQDEALTFKIVGAYYETTTKTITLGMVQLVRCSDIQIRAVVELPNADCSVVFEVHRANGTVYRLLPYQVQQLTEYLTETVEVKVVLTGTHKLSPILYAPIEFIAGEIAEEATYITNSMSLGTSVRVAAYAKAFLPGGATMAMHYSIAGAAFTSMPLSTTEALAFAQWTERKFEKTALTGTGIRLKITLTGGPAARAVAGDFGAGIF